MAAPGHVQSSANSGLTNGDGQLMVGCLSLKPERGPWGRDTDLRIISREVVNLGIGELTERCHGKEQGARTESQSRASQPLPCITWGLCYSVDSHPASLGLSLCISTKLPVMPMLPVSTASVATRYGRTPASDGAEQCREQGE